MKENKTILALILLKYRGRDELELQLESWKRYPTYTTDCPNEARKKEYKRMQFVERLRAGMQCINSTNS